MAAAYKTPGVYVEEISTLPPSVAEVSTAIPAFLGYTEKAPSESIARVSTLLEYEELFGGPSPAEFTVTFEDGEETVVERTNKTDFLMYYAVSHYFKNGGGACYVVSVGSYTADLIEKTPFETAIAKLETEDEPTIVVLVDAPFLEDVDYYALCQASLAHCKKLGDRFAILDVKDGDVNAFRNALGTANLNYGAAYHPYLQTSLNWSYADSGVKVVTVGDTAATTVTTTMDAMSANQTALYQEIKTLLAAQRVVLPRARRWRVYTPEWTEIAACGKRRPMWAYCRSLAR